MGGKQSWSFCIGDPSALLGHTLRDHDFATPTLIAIGHAKRPYLIQSSLDKTLNPREGTQHASSTQGSAFMAPDRRQCLQPPHPDHHPDGLASHHGPVVLPHQGGTLLESWLPWLLFYALGFQFYSTVSRQSFIETRTACSCVLKLNEKLEERGSCRRLGELQMGLLRSALQSVSQAGLRAGLGMIQESTLTKVPPDSWHFPYCTDLSEPQYRQSG